MKKITALFAVMTLTISLLAQAEDKKNGWNKSGDWIGISKTLFLELAGWTPQCETDCYPILYTYRMEEIGFYINKKTKKIVSVKKNNTPSIQYLHY